ncbi:MAG TPA: hypothetical protein VFE21_08885 [Rubrobacteraceae bacterium]|nr:hypothetical protein [Rubrobacteraceae bacterium]
MPVTSGDGAEVALIGGEDVKAFVPLGQHGAQCVGQVKGSQVGVTGEQRVCPCQVLIIDPVNLIGSLDLFDGGQLRLPTVTIQDKVVQLGQNQRGEKERAAGGAHRIEKEFMVILLVIENR